MREAGQFRCLRALMPVICLYVIVCAGCEQQGTETTGVDFAVDRAYKRGPVTVHVRVDKPEINIAGTLLLEFEAVAETGYHVGLPEVDGALINFGLLDWRTFGDKLDEHGRRVSRRRYRLEPFLSGDYELPAFTFAFSDADKSDAKPYELVTDPIAIKVTSLLGEQRAELEIEDIEGVVEMPTEVSPWWLWLLGAALVATTGALWFARRRQRVQRLLRLFRPAHELAYARLRALVGEDLVGAGRVKEFYGRISDILRHYIEDRFDLDAPERTTEEFLLEMQRTDVLTDMDKMHLTEYLKHCDLVKFAEHEPTGEQIQHTFNLTKEFIERTKSDEHRIEVTGPAAGSVAVGGPEV